MGKILTKYISILILLSFLFTLINVSADEQSYNDARPEILGIKNTDPSLPTSAGEQKGTMGYVMSRLFDANGKISNWFLSVLGTRSDTAVLRWSGNNGGQLVSGSIFDDGTNVGIGGAPSSYKLNVSGDINFTGDIRKNGTILNLAGKFQDGATSGEIYYNGGNVGIGTNNPGYTFDVSGTINATNLRGDGSSITNINGGNITDGTITSNQIANNTIASADINDGTIASVDISDGTIASIDISNGTIQSVDIADGSILTGDINDNTITEDDISDSFIARNSALLNGIDSGSFLAQQNDITGSVDLNTLDTTGLYHQNSNANATSGTNYPVGLAGMLEVVTDGSMVYQTYHTYNDNGKYYRSRYNGTWYPWKRIFTDGDSGDNIQDGTIDGSEIQNNSITGADIAANSINASELNVNSVSSTHIVNNTITEDDISDAFVARDSSLLDGIDSSSFIRSDAADVVTADTEWQDNQEVRFGDSADMRLFHNGTNSYIRNYTGNLELRNLSNGSNIYMQGMDIGGTTRNMIIADPDNEVRLYYAGLEKLNTRADGIQVTGTVIASDPTANNHLTTKSYVDSLVSSGVSWKAPVDVSASATYGSCNAAKEGWATYNKSDDIVYLCNASAWVSIGASASIPYATTTTAGRVQIAGDIQGTWNNITIKDNVITSSNIANSTITGADIANNSINENDIDADSINASELSDNSVASANIINDTITETDISNSFIARNSSLLDGIDSANFVRSNTNDNLTGNYQIWGTDTSGSYTNSPIEIREIGIVGNAQSSKAYAPAIAWHWGSTTQGQLALESDGVFRFRDGTTHTTLKNVEANSFIGNGANITSINGDNVTDGTIDSSEIQNNTITYNDISDGTVRTTEITNNTILNADINPAAAIAGSKISPDFGTQSVTTGQLFVAPGGSYPYIQIGNQSNDKIYADNSTGGGFGGGIWFRVANNDNTGYADALKIKENGRVQIDNDPVSGDDVGNRDYSDARYINVGESISGDVITNGTIDSSEIEDGTITGTDILNNTLTASDIGADSINASELSNNSVASANIIAGAIVNSDVNASAAISGTKISPNFGAQEIIQTTANGYRTVYGNYGSFWRQGGSNMYLMLTNSGDQYGSYNGLRPLRIGLATGDVTLDNGTLVVDASANTVDINSMIGNSTIVGNFGNMIKSTDEWLRLNDGKTHTNGVYTQGLIRADDGFQVDGITVIDPTAYIIGDRIQQNSIDSSEIQDGTITSSDILNNTLTASDIAADSINASELSNNSVASANVIDNSLTHNDVNLVCTRRSRGNNGNRRTNAVCLAGETVTGGGCYSLNGVDTLQMTFVYPGDVNQGTPVVPAGQEGYQCYQNGGNTYTVHAMCCRF